MAHLNNGYEWIIDLDIEKYFDTVNHDKLISILRENVNNSHTLHLRHKVRVVILKQWKKSILLFLYPIKAQSVFQLNNLKYLNLLKKQKLIYMNINLASFY